MHRDRGMNVKAIKDAIDNLNKSRGFSCAEILGGVSDDVIDIACEQTGYVFCEDYREFLRECGHIDIGTVQICGITNYGGPIQHTFQFITEEFINKRNGFRFPNTTLLYEEGDFEWVLLLDHNTGVVTPYDGLAKAMVHEQSSNLEDAILKQLLV
jgi:hypothetical protein